ncbi:MAG: tryptophan synthase subunit alpha [bacterium]|nr:tryptophan synthase subunit alpha [bacterium]
MKNAIDTIFEKKQRPLLMTHMVAGDPDMETCRRMAEAMERSGADLLEIQIPFSDPLADGPTIMAANQRALDKGVTPDDCFTLAADLSRDLSIPLLLMTYGNIVYRMGVEKFMARSAEAGVSGLIIPDIPYDERNWNLIPTIKKHGLYPIMVISPDTPLSRLEHIMEAAEGFVYVTLRVGITGTTGGIEPKSLAFIETVKKHHKIPLAAGFGISAPEHVKLLKDKVDIEVVGSHIINLFRKEGIAAVEEFIKQCKK